MDRTLGEWGRKCIGHWVNGVENPIISDRPVLQVIRTIREVINTSQRLNRPMINT